MSGTRRSSGGGSSSGGGGGGSSNRNNRSSGRGNNNDDMPRGGGGGVPPDFRNLMMHLMMSGGAGGDNRPEDLTKPSPVKCPQCQEEHEYHPAPAVGPLKHRYSHNARVLWHSAKCPVCLEDKDPPVVNLMCGHPLCLEHFERLNGKIGEDAMLSVAAQLAKEREERRNRANEDDGGGGGVFGPSHPLFEALMQSGMPGMPPPGMMFGGGGPGGGGGGGGGRNHPFQFLPDSDQLMNMVMADFGARRDDDDDDEDDDDEEEQYDDDDDDFDDMPPLIPSARGGTAPTAASGNTANNASSSRTAATANPRRGTAATAAAAAAASNTNNNRSTASNAASNNNNNNNGDSSSDDEDSMPGLIPRRAAATAAQGRNNNNNRTAPRQQPQQQRPGDSDSDDSDMPPLAPRGNTNRGTANGDDDTSSSDTDVPDLLAPNDDEEDSSDGEDDDDDDDGDEMPDLVPRDIEAEDSDGSDDDIPDLLPRGQEDDTGSDDDDDDRGRGGHSSSSEDSDMPGLIGRGTGNANARRANRANRPTASNNNNNNNRSPPRPNANRAANRAPTNRPNNNGDSSDYYDSDNESIPGLLPRSGVEAADAAPRSAPRSNTNNASSDDSSNDGDDSMPELLQRDNDSADEEDSTPAAAAARVVPTREMIDQWTAEEMTKGRRMKPGELKRKLRSMNVDTSTFFEKPELVRAWADQMVQRRVDNYMPTPAEVRAAATASAAAAAAAAAPPPVDPYADMPPLMLAEDPPPKNGIWLFSPASSSSGSRHDDRVILHYTFVQGSRVRSVQRGFFPKGSVILSFREGTCWIYAPMTTGAQSNPGVAAAASAASTTTTTTNNHSWELIAVRDINLTVPLFTFEWPGAEAASVVLDGRGAAYVLLPTDPSNPSTCDRTLIRINSQYEEGKNILQQLVPCHSHMYRDRRGGVWIHVPNHNQSGSNSGVTTRMNEDTERLTPGIWYITPFEVSCIVSHVSPDAKISLDGRRKGLLLLCPMEEEDGDDDESSLLVHVGPAGELHRRIIPVNFSKVAAVLDDGNRGALLHCRNSDNRWKLCRCPWKEVNEEGEMNAPLVEFADCPGRTKLVTDGRGGVWIWKKVGKRNNRAVSYISRTGELTESTENFPGGAVMEG